MDQLGADFRSDTFTLPSRAMKEAMAIAPLGDDVFAEDPSVNKLQAEMAETLGMEAALFFPSGSMANLTALMTQAKPGSVLYTGAMSHIHHYEMGGYSKIAGLALKEVDDSKGFLDRDDLAKKWNPEIYYMPQPGIIAVENSHNMLGGLIYPESELQALREFADRHNIPIHMDGARLFHAAAGAGKQPTVWTKHVDSVMVSISKGLGGPVGSVLCASMNVIKEARCIRKLLGGGMRQAGVLAAAGSYALAHHMEALSLDIERSQHIYRSLDGVDTIRLVPPQTNILIGEVADGLAPDLVSFLAERKVKCLAISPNRVRFVFHLNNTDEGCQSLLDGLLQWNP